MSEFDVRHAAVTPGPGVSPDTSVAPGRAAPTNALSGPTNDSFIDGGGARDTSFLTELQRARLAIKFGLRVNAALTAYHSALAGIHADRLVEKDDDLPWVVTLIIGALGVGVESGIKAAMKGLRGMSEEALHGFYEHEIETGRLTTYLKGKIAKVSDETIKVLAKPAGEASRHLVTSRAQNMTTKIESPRAAGLSYLERLKADANKTFEQLRERPLEAATDAQLLALYHAWSSDNHNEGIYRLLLEEQIGRYESSKVRQIGPSLTSWGRQDAKGNPDIGRNAVFSVAWIELGLTRRLAHMKQWGYQDDSPFFEEWVDDDFEDVALERQYKHFGSPKTFRWDFTKSPPVLHEVGTSTVGQLAEEMSTAAEREKSKTDIVKLPGVK